jgi:hypothetical protein
LGSIEAEVLQLRESAKVSNIRIAERHVRSSLPAHHHDAVYIRYHVDAEDLRTEWRRRRS